ncbi:MAG: SRPBCC family protein [Acidobacteriaceae bacterium]|nr:SRPBCC family protein [Acidobacteriaceae bacterium]
MPHRFHAEQWLPYPSELVFAFFANPENLPRLMPPWQQVRIEEGSFAPPPPRPLDSPRFPGIVAGNGSRILISARALPRIPARGGWEALIEDFRWNEGFCDIQLRGPFKSWRHCHSVKPEPGPDGRPGTRVTDDITYELPLGPLGALANLLIARRALAYAFRIRQERTLPLLARAAQSAGTRFA